MRQVIGRENRITVIGPSLPLKGTVIPPGAKNSAMPFLVAGALARDPVVFRRVPDIADVNILLDILKGLGTSVEADGDWVSLSGGDVVSSDIPARLSSLLRGSVYALTVPAVRLGRARIGPIGGDSLAGRTLEPHARAFAGFGMTLSRVGDGWEVSGSGPRAGEFRLDDHGVSATAIAILMGASIEGRSVIREASLELEISDVIDCVRALGAKVERDGRTIIVEGPLAGGAAQITLPEDQIYCGTMAMAAAVTGGDIEMPASVAPRMKSVLEALAGTGVEVSVDGVLHVQGFARHPFDVETGMYPKFPTDLLPQMMALLTQASGHSFISERVYKSRYGHVSSLERMGAQISVRGNRATVTGPARLVGTQVEGAGIRETASLLIAALAARGQTIIHNANALYRGYEDLSRDLSRLGADSRSESSEHVVNGVNSR